MFKKSRSMSNKFTVQRDEHKFLVVIKSGYVINVETRHSCL